MSYPLVSLDSVGWITEAQMIEVDRVMVEDLHIDLLQMMENAGRNLAHLVLDLHAPERVSVAAGSGGNGGGGMVAARHLANAGVDVTVTLTRDVGQLSGVPAHQLDILQRMGVAVASDLAPSDLCIDAVIGYSLQGPPRGRSEQLISEINTHDKVISLDTPSGLDVTTGDTPGEVVRADATMTLCLPKVGLRQSPVVGTLYLADISVPPAITAALGPAAPDFAAGPILQIS